MSKQSEYRYLTASQSIAKFERELHEDQLGGFYQWADALFDNAWSKAAGRLDRAINLYMQHAISEHDFNVERAMYFEKCQELMQEYRKYKKLDETGAFLKSLGKGENDYGTN